MSRSAKRNPYGGKSPDPLARLRRRGDVTARSLVRALQSSLASIRARIATASDPAYAKSQEELYDGIARALGRFGKKLDRYLKDDVAFAATDAAHRADDMSGSILKWDEARARRYWRYVAPQQGKNLAAVFTDKMGEDIISSLRQSLVEVEREAVIEGWTMNEKQKAVQERWAELARDDSAFNFVDRSGKAWDNARYLQMLTRTTAQRVYNDALADRLAEDGSRYARIVSMGTPGCGVCAAWQQQIVVLGGRSRQFPTLADAREAGVFHPNCLCTLEYIDEDLDGEEIERQRDAGKVDWDDADAVQERADEIAVGEMRAQGMSKDEAEESLTRGKVEDAIRAGLFTDDAKSLAAGFTREQLAEFRKNGVPRFELAKKGDKVGFRRGSAGGVVHLDRDDIAGGMKEIFGEKEGEPPRRREWTPQTALERSTDAIMRQIGATHSEERLDPVTGNPHFGNTDEAAPYRVNCQRCVPTAEARMRGYDVEASPRPMIGAGRTRRSDPDDPLYSGTAPGAANWLFPTFRDAQPIRYRQQSDIERQMAAWGDGTRAQIVCTWRGRRPSAHTFLAIQENGHTRFVDPQTGSRDCSRYFRQIPRRGRRATIYNNFARIDNLEMNDRMRLVCSPRPREEQ